MPTWEVRQQLKPPCRHGRSGKSSSRHADMGGQAKAQAAMPKWEVRQQLKPPCRHGRSGNSSSRHACCSKHGRCSQALKLRCTFWCAREACEDDTVQYLKHDRAAQDTLVSSGSTQHWRTSITSSSLLLMSQKFTHHGHAGSNVQHSVDLSPMNVGYLYSGCL